MRAPASPNNQPQSTPATTSRREPVSPLLLSRLATYAQGRLQAGAANELLTGLGADLPRLIAAYRVGFIPADYHDALGRDDRLLLVGQTLGNRLVLPASDAAGQVVDLLGVNVDKRGRVSLTGTAGQPLGLLASVLSTAHDELLITDSVSILVDCFRQGHHNTLLLRGVADARGNAERLARAGVRRVIIRTRRDDGGIPNALAAAGIDVSGRTAVAVPTMGAELGRVAAEAVGAAPAPAPARPAAPDRLRVVSEDRTAEVVLIEAGPIRYAVERHHLGDDPRRLVVVRALGRVAQDRLDLASEPQRRRFAGNAGQQLGVAAEALLSHLEQLGPLLAGRAAAEQERQLASVPRDQRDGAEAMLAAPNLLECICDDLTALGWVGEERAKALLYLTGISRHLPSPLWTVYRSAAGAAPWQATALVAALTPLEERLVFHRLTDSAIRGQDGQQLRHRLVVVDQAETLRPEAALAMRVLHERGGIGWATLASDAVGEARGPVAVIAAAAGDLDPRFRDCFVSVPADERPEQTARVLADQRRQRGALASQPVAHAAIVARHHAMQRLLVRRPVVVPDAERIVFPAARVRHRGEQAWFLSLVEAIAFLHQRQRQEQGGAIVATEADIALAARLSSEVLAVDADGLGRGASRVLDALRAQGAGQFTIADLARLFPDWSRFAFRAALQDLADLGYVAAGPPTAGGRGHLRTYALLPSAPEPAPGIRLRPAYALQVDPGTPESGEVAESGCSPKSHFRSGDERRLG
jgi:hypothetical protein